MPASEAQVRANQENAKKSTGPKTEAGKEASRANAYKHGMTATKVLPELEAAEVKSRYAAFCGELQPSGKVGMAMAKLAAIMSVRAERCFEHENATLTERVRNAIAEIEYPEGISEAAAAQIRDEVGKRALFDASPEATLARKYEAAAQRGFFKAIKELRAHEKAIEAAREAAIDEKLASFLPGEMTDDEFDRLYAETVAEDPEVADDRSEMAAFERLQGRIDVPFAIGKRR
jgi:hypothetical protein